MSGIFNLFIITTSNEITLRKRFKYLIYFGNITNPGIVGTKDFVNAVDIVVREFIERVAQTGVSANSETA